MTDVRINVPPRLIEAARAAQYANRAKISNKERLERIKKGIAVQSAQQQKKKFPLTQEREGGQLEFTRVKRQKVWTKRRLLGEGWLLAPVGNYFDEDFLLIVAGGVFDARTFATSNCSWGVLRTSVAIFYADPSISFLDEVAFLLIPPRRFAVGNNKLRATDNIALPSLVRTNLLPSLAKFRESWSGSICYGCLSYMYPKEGSIASQEENTKDQDPLNFRAQLPRMNYKTKEGAVFTEIESILSGPQNGINEWTMEGIFELPSISLGQFTIQGPHSRDDLNLDTFSNKDKDFSISVNSYYSEFVIKNHLSYKLVEIVYIETFYVTNSDTGSVARRGFWSFNNAALPAVGGTYHCAIQFKDNAFTTLFNGQIANTILIPALDFQSPGVDILSAAWKAEIRHTNSVNAAGTNENISIVHSSAPEACIGFHSLRFTPKILYPQVPFDPPSRITELA